MKYIYTSSHILSHAHKNVPNDLVVSVPTKNFIGVVNNAGTSSCLYYNKQYDGRAFNSSHKDRETYSNLNLTLYSELSNRNVSIIIVCEDKPSIYNASVNDIKVGDIIEVFNSSMQFKRNGFVTGVGHDGIKFTDFKTRDTFDWSISDITRGTINIIKPMPANNLGLIAAAASIYLDMVNPDVYSYKIECLDYNFLAEISKEDLTRCFYAPLVMDLLSKHIESVDIKKINAIAKKIVSISNGNPIQTMCYGTFPILRELMGTGIYQEHTFIVDTIIKMLNDSGMGHMFDEKIANTNDRIVIETTEPEPTTPYSCGGSAARSEFDNTIAPDWLASHITWPNLFQPMTQEEVDNVDNLPSADQYAYGEQHPMPQEEEQPSLRARALHSIMSREFIHGLIRGGNIAGIDPYQ